ncbi:excinuclease ABC subunit UvrA [Candidatus Mycalebacterium sp.]
MSFINIKGARSHNLKNISAKIPRGKLVTITGVSGSGKSSLAFDTLFAEGQRRFMQSLSAYARQFVEQLEKPDVDFMDGLSPSISLDQKTFYRNPRSTVGTITEIYDFMRLLFARAGKPMCHRCGEEISPQTAQAMAKRILSSARGEEVTVMSQIVRGRKGLYRKEIEDLKKEGFVRAFIDGEERDLDEEIVLDRNKTHDIEVVVDTVGTLGAGARKRLEDSLTLALKKSGGNAVCTFGNKTVNFSETFSCPSCGETYGEISPRIFSFNSPYGMCGECSGLGVKTDFDPELIVNPLLSIRNGAIKPWKNSRYHKRLMEQTAEYHGFSTDVPFGKLPAKARRAVLYGNGHGDDSSGVIGALAKWRTETSSSEVESGLAEYMKKGDCPSCGGARLRRESLSVFVNQKTIYDISRLEVEDALRFFADLKLGKYETEIGGGIVEEIKSRIGFLKDIGLGYIALDRSAATLSSGEAQRIRLATQLGSKMTGVTYVLDEPSIGLHPSDNDKLIRTLKTMRDNGNTIVVVEHDEDMIRNSDFVLDMGPEAGRRGGEITGCGTVRELISCKGSLTGRYLSGREAIEVPLKRRKPEEFITLKGAAKNNLAGLDVSFPVGVFTCITGVSGSGKSTLLHEILCPAIESARRGKAAGDGFKAICGTRHADKIVKIDQVPIGRTPRSNPATYTGIFSPIRELFAMTPEAKLRGYGTGRFSFNVREGSCGLCGGKGSVKVEMHFLPDVYATCERCGGKRFESETLEITYRDKNISDVLQMTVSEAVEFFSKHPRINRKLDIVEQVGLGYVKLGQEANTLSGGEAQRIKIAKELSQKETGKTLYVLDEPSTGLHFNDVKKLLAALEKLIKKGNTMIVIEHNMEIIKSADYVIDMGPGGGKNGGKIVAEGSPEELARSAKSLTGKYLKKALDKKRRN